jgi:hypothetical protein
LVWSHGRRIIHLVSASVRSGNVSRCDPMPGFNITIR